MNQKLEYKLPPIHLQSLDTLRGIAVFLMLFFHFLAWLMQEQARGNFYNLVSLLANYLAPPIFFIIVGVSLSLSLEAKRKDSLEESAIRKYIFERYGALILIGLLVNVIVWGSLGIWDVLECIGTAGIITYLLITYFASPFIPLFIGGAFLLLYYYFVNHFSPTNLPAMLVKMLKGSFALEPFLFFVIVGAVIGKLIFKNIRIGNYKKTTYQLLLSGTGLLLLSLALHFLGNPIQRVPLSISYIIFSLGITNIFLSIIFWWQDQNKHQPRLLLFFSVYGVFAFSIYIGHHIVYKVCYYLNLLKSLSFITSIVVTTALMILIFISAYLWQRYEQGKKDGKAKR